MEDLAPAFAALSDPTRAQLLRTLGECGPLGSSALARRACVSRQAISRHLAVLERGGLVTSERVGREVRYAVDASAMEGLGLQLQARARDWAAGPCARAGELGEADPTADLEGQRYVASRSKAVAAGQVAIPFHPVPRDWPGFSMPPSVPDGMRLELSRSKIVPGAEPLAHEWMAQLNSRCEEAAAGLAGEGIALEATFFSPEVDGSLWIYHLTIGSTDPPGAIEPPPPGSVGAMHLDHNQRAKMRGWEELRPEVLLVPTSVGDALVAGCSGGEGPSGGTHAVPNSNAT